MERLEAGVGNELPLLTAALRAAPPLFARGVAPVDVDASVALIMLYGCEYVRERAGRAFCFFGSVGGCGALVGSTMIRDELLDVCC